MAKKVHPAGLLVEAALIAIIAGVVSFALVGVLGPISANVFGSIVVSIVLLVAVLLMANTAKVDNLNIFNFVVFLFAIAIVGTLVTLAYPPLSQYILSVSGNFTVTGLMWTIFYIMAAEVVLIKSGIAKKLY